MKWIYENDRVRLVDGDGTLMSEAILTETDRGDIDIEHVFVDSSLRG